MNVTQYLYEMIMDTMEKNVEKALDNFVDEPQVDAKINDAKKAVLDEREGLIERVDKIFVDKSGRMLLREQY